jgi:hypothetical protein
LQHPKNASFQGTRADLRGLVVEVVFSNNSTPVRISETENADLFTNLIADFCDKAYDGWGTGVTPPATPQGAAPGYAPVTLTYKGSNVFATLRIPHVEKAERLEFVQDHNNLPVWYVDKRPQFAGEKYNVYYPVGWKGWGDTAGDHKEITRRLETASVDYPKVDYTNASKEKVLTAYIGSDTPTNDLVIGKYLISKYYQVTKVEFDSADWLAAGVYKDSLGIGGFFDDDVDAFYSDGDFTKPDPIKVFDQFKKASVKFKVTYNNGEDSRVMDTYEFVANTEWFYNQSGLGAGADAAYTDYKTYMRSKILTSDGVDKDIRGGTSVFKFDPNFEEQWRILVDYSPWSYNNSASGTAANVPIDMYLWDDALEAKPVGSRPVMWAQQDEWSFTPDASVSSGYSEFESLKNSWQLIGSYTNTKYKAATKPIKLTPQMFYYGYFGASWAGDPTRYQGRLGQNSGWTSLNDVVTNGAALAGFTETQKIKTQLIGGTSLAFNSSTKFDGWNNSVGLNQYLSEYPLPVYYRGERLDDEDGITVDLVGTGK